MRLTSTLHALLDSEYGPFAVSLVAGTDGPLMPGPYARLDVLNHLGGYVLGSLNEAGIPKWARAGNGAVKRKKPFTSIQEAGEFFVGLFKEREAAE